MRSGHVAGETESQRGATIATEETFSLSGKPRHEGDELDASRYAWLEFKPPWKSIVLNREEGGA